MMRRLGQTGLMVSAVGLGAGRIGGDSTSDADVDRLVSAALDAGVNLFDSARSYGESEARLGRALRGRRERAVLSTKIGYGIPGTEDWTGRCIEQGVDAALERFGTDCIDICHFHSCPLEVLRRGDVLEALSRAVSAGKVRAAAYSGENDALEWAVASGAFAVVQCSVSVVDQGVLSGAVARASERGLGVLAKRPLGNAPWRFSSRPAEGDVAEAWERFQAMQLSGGDLASVETLAQDWADRFARFAAHAPGVSSILVGTASAEHLLAAVAAVARGPLSAEEAGAFRAAYARKGAGWGGRI
jgi:aryl-alcohol dehydrogenase-like predicted oxidoreductase